MALPLRLFHVVAANRLVCAATGTLATQPFALPDFVSGGTIHIEYQALVGNGAPYEIQPVSTYSGPEIGIFSSAAVQLAFQNSFTADGVNNIYSGDLSTNDANFTTAVSALTPASDPVVGYFTIRTTDSDGRPVNLPPQEVNLWKALITPGAVTTPPGDVTATQAWALNTFVPKDGDGVPQIIRSRDSLLPFVFYLDDLGQPHYEPLV